MDALTIKDLRKVYSNGVEALKGIDLTVREGDFFALLGPNGAGKTTAIGIVTSLIRKSGGSVSVFGHDIERERDAAKACIGVVPQEINLNMFERNDHTLVNQAGYYGVPKHIAQARTEKYLKALHLWDRRSGIARTLSGGMKRRLLVAKAMVHSPPILVLDEPTAGVDIELRQQLWDYVRGLNRQGVTVVLTTHYLEEAEQLCDRIAIINHGRLIANEPTRELIAKAQDKAVMVEVDRDLDGPPDASCFEKIDITGPRTLEIIYRKDKVNAGQVLDALQKEGFGIVDVSTRDPDLEDVFLSLTREVPA